MDSHTRSCGTAQGVADPLCDLCLGHFLFFNPDRYVVVNAHVGPNCVVLENDADLAVFRRDVHALPLNTVLPLTVISPISGFKNPQSARMAMVFPQPDRPTFHDLPGSRVRENPSKPCGCRRKRGYVPYSL